MFSWLAANAANILISIGLIAVVFFIIRGMVRGRIKTCSCGSSSCSQCAGSDPASCGSCPYCAAREQKNSK